MINPGKSGSVGIADPDETADDAQGVEKLDILKMKKFLSTYQDVEKSLETVKMRVDDCEQCSRRLLDATTEQQLSEEECRMNLLINSIDNICNENRIKLETLKVENDNIAKVAPRGSGDLRMRRIKTAALANKFASLISRFQNVQRNARLENTDLIQRQYKISRFLYPWNDAFQLILSQPRKQAILP